MIYNNLYGSKLGISDPTQETKGQRIMFTKTTECLKPAQDKAFQGGGTLSSHSKGFEEFKV